MSDPYQYFRTEARELVDKLSRGVLDLEKGRGDGDLVSQLLRHAHTLKGAARVVKQTAIAELSHAIEEILGPYRETSGAVASGGIAQLLAHLDAIAAHVTSLSTPPAPHQAAMTRDERAAEKTGDERAAEPIEEIRVTTAKMDALLRGLADLRVGLASLEQQTTAIGQVVQRTSGLTGERDSARAAASGGPGELATDEPIATALKTVHRALELGLDRVDRELGQLYDRASEMRLIPAGSLFGALERSVRDAAQELDKQVEFVAGGGDIRLDAHGLNLLRGALMHLVRNAVVHGIEPPADRVTMGKPAAGRVTLNVHRKGDHAVFHCTDDGRGIDLDRVRQALVARGRLSPAEAKALIAETAVKMLFRGGISTTVHATELSGRGIGLDVVRDSVARLKGTAVARTQSQRGTTVEISIPVSVESADVLHVELGRSRVSIPLSAVRRALRLRAAEVIRSAQGEWILCDGENLPLVPLANLLAPGTPHAPREESASRGARRVLTALVLDDGSAAAAVGVDRLLGRERVIVRALPAILGALPAVMGASFDSAGDPQLVLDPAGLIRMAHAGMAAPGQLAPAVRPPLLVIDDSLTTRMLEQGILETAGYEVETASSGEEALQKARSRSYGVFLVDVEMPGMDGFEFIEASRGDPRLAPIPAIVVTSRDAPQDRQRAARLGAKAYIVKGRFDEALLLRTIGELVG